MVKLALLLEHGCEKTHNDYMREQLLKSGIDPEKFGWASVQLDGGIARALERVEDWFRSSARAAEASSYEDSGLESLHLGLLSFGPVCSPAGHLLGGLTRLVVNAGGSVVVPESTTLFESAEFRKEVSAERHTGTSLAYGQRIPGPGFYVMENPTDHWVEMLTGAAATGVSLVLGYTSKHPVQGHPMVPVLQVTADAEVAHDYGEDLDLILTEPSDTWLGQIVELIAGLASNRLVPKLFTYRNIDFQLSRGLLGVSM